MVLHFLVKVKNVGNKPNKGGDFVEMRDNIEEWKSGSFVRRFQNANASNLF